MVQIYFLSIVLNALAGYSLTLDPEGRPGIMAGVREVLREETVRLIIAVLTMVIGLFKLLSVIRGDVPVIGDLIPAVCGLTAGFSLLFDFYRSRSKIIGTATEQMEWLFHKNRKWIGYVTMLSALTHFLFPAVLFL